MSLLESAERIYSSIRLHIRLIILRIILFVRQSLIYRTSPSLSNTRTVLLLGDVTALGLGDTPPQLGLTTRLLALIREARSEAALRLYWHVVTAGVLGSRVEDWAPGAGRGLFEATVARGPFRRADVVVVVLGAHDDVAGDPGRVAAGVGRVVEGVVRVGKEAVVVAFPNAHARKSAEWGRVREANEMLEREVERVRRECNGRGEGGVRGLVDMGKVLAMGNEVVRFENEFVGLNGNGYRLLAREVYEEFLYSAKKVEWAHWKRKLEGSAGAW